MKKLCLFLLIIQASLANPLQDAIDSANPGDIIELGDAKYTGNIIINKAITIDGKNKAVIQGDEKGDVIKIM